MCQRKETGQKESGTVIFSTPWLQNFLELFSPGAKILMLGKNEHYTDQSQQVWPVNLASICGSPIMIKEMYVILEKLHLIQDFFSVFANQSNPLPKSFY